MVELHNKPIYTRYYNKFSAQFLDLYAEYRLLGLGTDEALERTKSKLKQRLLVEVVKDFSNHATINFAYKNVLKDSEIIKLALRKYHGLKG